MASYTIGPEDVCLWYSDTHLRLPELRKTLQRQDFPRATRTLLEWLHRYFVQCENFPPGKFPNRNCVSQLIEEFVFYRNSGVSRVQQKMTAIQELRLLEELCNHFQLKQDLITRHNAFDSFFGCKSGPVQSTDEHRTSALNKLVSMAIAVNCIPVLDCAAVLIHNQGATEAILSLTKSVVEDYCTLIPSARDLLSGLVDSSPQFVCQLMAAISSVYDVDRDPKTKPSLPPLVLLEVLADWTSDHPLIFIEHLLHPSPGIPPFHHDGSEPTQAPSSRPRLQGPLSGLIKASVLSPLILGRPVGPHRLQDNGNPPSSTEDDDDKKHLLYSKLHLGILQALLATRQMVAKLRNPGPVTVKELLTLDDVEDIVGSLRRLLRGGAALEEAAVDVALDRLAQVVQVAWSTGALNCLRSAVHSTMKGLPENQLMTLVLHQEGAIQ